MASVYFQGIDIHGRHRLLEKGGLAGWLVEDDLTPSGSQGTTFLPLAWRLSGERDQIGWLSGILITKSKSANTCACYL